MLMPGRSRLRTLHLMSLATRRRRAIVLVPVGASQGWNTSLLSLSALEIHLVGLGVLLNVDCQAESKVSSHVDVFDSMWPIVGLAASSLRGIRIVSCDCQPSLLLLSLSLSLSLSLFIPLSLSLSLSLPLSASLQIVMHTDNCGNLKPGWKTRSDHDMMLLFQNVVGVHVLVAFSVAETRRLFSFRCLTDLP